LSRTHASNDSYRMTVLLAALVLLLLLGPWFAGVRGGRLISVLAGGAIPVAGVYAVMGRNRPLAAAIALAILGAATSVWSLFSDSRGVLLAASILSLAFYALVAAVLLRHVFRSGGVSHDTLAAAACVYVLLGWIWWFAYGSLEILEPGSFAGLSPFEAGGRIDLLYFSFVTLTTLGYGDVTPAAPRAMSLAIVEAVTGVLFLAVLIARLVSLYRAPEAS